MAKVRITKDTPAGMVMAGGILATAVGMINLITGEDAERSLTMLVAGVLITAVCIILLFRPRRNPNVRNTPVVGPGNGVGYGMPNSAGPNRNIRSNEELYFRVCNAVADLHVVPRVQRTYGHEYLRQRIRQDPQFAWTLFQQEPSRDLLQYIHSFDPNAAYKICMNAANALSWRI